MKKARPPLLQTQGQNTVVLSFHLAFHQER